MEQTEAERSDAETQKEIELSELKKSGEQYRQLVENALDCILLMDLDGIIRFANRAALALASPVNLIGLSMRDILPSEHIKRHEELLQTGRAGISEVCSFEWDLFKPDDCRHLIMDVRTSMLTENGQPSGVIMIARDVTDQKRRDATLRMKDVELRAVVESSGIGILAVDNNGRVILSNRRFAELWDIPSDLMETNSNQVLLTHAVNQVADPKAFLEKVKLLNQSTSLEHDMLWFKDGRIVERYAYPLLNDGAVLGRACSFRDVTAQNMAETALRNSELLFKNAFSMNPTMMDIRSLGDRIFLEVNESFLRHTGYQREEIIGRSVSELGLIDSDTVQRLSKIFSENDMIDSQEIQYKTKTGELRYGLYSVTHIGDGKQKKVLGLLYDITERKRSEALLKLREEESRTLARNIEEANIALRVVLARRDENQKMLEERIQANVNDIILPFIHSLKRIKMEDRDRHYIDLLESNLKSILSPFMKNLSGNYPRLTPKEMQIVEMIRQGKNSKDIAAMLGSSAATVNTHRNNIRKKLNVRKQKTNLRSHLLSLT